MDHWTQIARAATDDGDQLVLRRRGEEFDIRFNGWELMASRTSRSEEALARLACDELKHQPEHVLIGGLGMGYTLRATLDLIGPNACVVVSELVPAVVEWVRGPLAELAHHPLDDPRVDIRLCGVVAALATSPRRFDLILLDTDNGPQAVLHSANAFLYSREGLNLAMRALKSDGGLAYWSADPSAKFERDLDAAGVSWRRADIHARDDGSGPQHSIYLVRPVGL